MNFLAADCFYQCTNRNITWHWLYSNQKIFVPRL